MKKKKKVKKKFTNPIQKFAQSGGVARWAGYTDEDRHNALKKAWETRRKNIATQNKVD